MYNESIAAMRKIPVALPIVSDFFNEMDASEDGYVTMEEIHTHARSNGPIVMHVAIGAEPVDMEE